MSIEKKQNRYLDIIWDNQLPPNERAFLYHLLNGEPSSDFYYNPNSDYSLFLAYNAQKNEFQGYSPEQVGIFRDILREYKYQKLRKIPVVSKVLRVLNDNGIVPLLVKGAAFLCYYSPEIPRMMGDIDIYISPEYFEKAMTLIYGLGFEFVNDTGYHIEVTSENLDMDVHRYIYKNGGDVESDIYDRLISCSYLGSKVYILSPEDMLVHQLANRGQDICVLSHMERHLKWIIDSYSILSFCKPDVNSILQKAKKLNNFYYVKMTLEKLMELFPEKFTGQCYELKDKNYVRFLRCAKKQITVNAKYPLEKTNGLAYVYSKFQMNWTYCRILKILTKSHEPVAVIMLHEHDVHSFADGVYKIRKLLKKSK